MISFFRMIKMMKKIYLFFKKEVFKNLLNSSEYPGNMKVFMRKI